MNTFVLFTFSGEGLPIAYKLRQEGWNVVVGMLEDINDIYTKIEPKVPEPPEYKKRRLANYKDILKTFPARELLRILKKPTTNRQGKFLFFDLNHCFRYAEALMNEGYEGNFPTEKDRLMEVNRDLAKDFVKKHYPDINVAEVHEFKKVDEAKKFLENTQEFWVLKGQAEDAKTVVPSNTEDPELAKEELLEGLQKDPKTYESAGFILELKIPNPIEITPEKGYYNGQALYTTIDLELKRIGAGDTGQMTGCSADLVFMTDMKAKINKIAFPPIVDEMAKKHKGLFIWDLSILFDPRNGKPYMGEFCPNRPGYNCFYSELAMLDEKTFYFDSIVQGKNPFEESVAKFTSSVRLFNRHADSKIPKLMVKDAKLGISNEAEPDVWPMNVNRDIEGFKTIGYEKDLAVVTGFGDTIEQSAKLAYKYVDGVSFNDVEYRYLGDYLATDYPGSIRNRYKYLEKNKWI